jgi:uncharacterized protein YbaR (Trm112 family)
MKIIKILRCIECLIKKKNSKLKVDKKNKVISCLKCKEKYPIYENIPVIISKSGDFHHLRRALLPAKYRVNQKI